MIISASRRTDIPAYYSEWFSNRAKAGYCLVRNPFNPAQVSRISLLPEDVDAIVFWTKNPAPILPRLDELERYRYYFQFTLNGYPKELEAHLPPLEQRIAVFKELSRRLGSRRVVWRYDPVIVSNRTGFAWHREMFSALCQNLAGHTVRVMTSAVEYYKKTERNLSALEGFVFDKAAVKSPAMEGFFAFMAETARRAGMEVFSCAQERDYSAVGVRPGSCVDGGLINELWGLSLPVKKDPGQRKFCLCAVSRDIGSNDTCISGCRYCYATKDHERAKERYRNHRPDSEMLVE
ncbi:MAG: DUF1848 domain-containing protein [Nitrospinae bacterium]|nr:DUF1848 domain-containing protein [Nitrospinota bacterium]